MFASLKSISTSFGLDKEQFHVFVKIRMILLHQFYVDEMNQESLPHNSFVGFLNGFLVQENLECSRQFKNLLNYGINPKRFAPWLLLVLLLLIVVEKQSIHDLVGKLKIHRKFM